MNSEDDYHLQFVSFEGSVMQQVEASVVLLGEVDVGHQDQDLNDAAEVFSDGIMEWCVSIWILFSKAGNTLFYTQKGMTSNFAVKINIC